MRLWLALFIPLLIAAAEPRSFTIGGEAFGESEILDARAQPDVTGHAAIMITFDEAGAKRLARISTALVAKPMPILLDGTLLGEPVVNEPITVGVAQISGNFTVAQAEQIAKKISGKPPLRDSLDDSF